MTLLSIVTASCVRGLFAGLALAMLTAVQSQAATFTSRTIIGTNYLESSQQTSTTPPTPSSCTDVGGCFIEFSPVPGGKQLVITHVSCELTVSVSGAQAVAVILTTRLANGSSPQRFQHFVPSTLPSNQPGYHVVFNSDTYYPFGAHETPVVFLALNENADVGGFCNIAGQITVAE